MNSLKGIRKQYQLFLVFYFKRKQHQLFLVFNFGYLAILISLLTDSVQPIDMEKTEIVDLVYAH